MIRIISSIVLLGSVLVTLCGQDLDPRDVHVSLDQALPIALAKAKRDFLDLENYILHSVGPRALKGDPNGLCWEFIWQEKAFPHYNQLRVRVYMRDGLAQSTRESKGSFQKSMTKSSSPKDNGSKLNESDRSNKSLEPMLAGMKTHDNMTADHRLRTSPVLGGGGSAWSR